MPPEEHPLTFRVFVSYSHEDSKYLEGPGSLLGFLKGLESEGVEFWHDRRIGAGELWDETIKREIARSNLALVLVSQAFLHSDYCRNKEIPKFLEQRLPIIAVILSACQWQDADWLAARQFRPGLDETVEEHYTQEGARKRLWLQILQDITAKAQAWREKQRAIQERTAKIHDPLIDLLAPLLDSSARRFLSAAATLGDMRALDAYQDSTEAARTLVERATGDDAPRLAAHRIASGLIDVLQKDWPGDVEPLIGFRDAIELESTDGEESGLLAAWLRKVVTDHDRLVPYFQQQTEYDLLDRVYVQLELRHDRNERLVEGTKNEDAIHFGRPMRIAEVLALDPDVEDWVTRRWVILGDPGAGKTTLLRHLAADLARQESSHWVPVFESLPRLTREREWILDRLEWQLGQGGDASEGLATVLDRAGQEGRLLLMLDGLDEVPKEARTYTNSLLRRLSDRWPKTVIIVSSRPIGFQRIPGFQELELQPFDAERRRTFLVRWFGRGGGSEDHPRADAAAQQLETDSNLRELASNPLYLTLMALLIEQGTSPATNRTRLYDQVFQLLLIGGHRPGQEAIACQQAVHGVLRHLAFEMTRENLDAEAVTELEARLYQPNLDNLRDQLERIPKWRRGLRPFLDSVAEQTGILGPHDGPDTDWRFWHRTFREALASEALEQQYRDGGADKVLEHARSISGDESRWAEAYSLLTGRIDDPDELVKALVKENRDLGLRALATAQALSDATLDEILELSTEWKERIEVYKRIPDLIDDPPRVLALIDRLRRRTHNGNDLYHLDLAAEIVARRSPEYERAARDLRSRLYDHIPAPPEDLFQWVETVDGRVELWKEIPAGRFLMGSPDDEEGRYDDEGPQHEVVIESGFRLATVPVTQAQFRVFDPEHRSRFEGY